MRSSVKFRCANADSACTILITHDIIPTFLSTAPRARVSWPSKTARRCAAWPGLSTELADVSEVEYRQLRLERVVLVGVWTEGSAADADASLAELAALAETAGSEVLEGLIQRRDKPDPSTYIGSGKAAGTARRGRRDRRRHRHLRR